MLQPGWLRGVTTNATLTLEAVVDQIDHVCQLAGSAATPPSAPTWTAATARNSARTTAS